MYHEKTIPICHLYYWFNSWFPLPNMLTVILFQTRVAIFFHETLKEKHYHFDNDIMFYGQHIYYMRYYNDFWRIMLHWWLKIQFCYHRNKLHLKYKIKWTNCNNISLISPLHLLSPAQAKLEAEDWPHQQPETGRQDLPHVGPSGGCVPDWSDRVTGLSMMPT